MTRVALAKAEDHGVRGTWVAVADFDGTIRPIVYCGACGEGSFAGHAVAADGTLNPSYVCPHAPCDWHIWGRLLDWDLPPVGRRPSRP